MIDEHLENLKEDPIAFLKENLNLLIVIPAAVGGLWQLKELSNMSVSFIRFFSLSQLVADGLLILLIFSFTYAVTEVIPTEFAKIFKKTTKPITKEDKKDNVRSLNSGIYFNYIFFWVLYCMFIYFIYTNKSLDGFSFYRFIVLSWCAILVLKGNLRISSKIIKEKYTHLLHYGTILLYFTYYLIAIKIADNLHSAFILPNNLTNISFVKNQIKKENPNSIVKLVYLNDKYIFFELHSKPKAKNDEKNKVNKIQIIKFEDLFKEK